MKIFSITLKGLKKVTIFRTFIQASAADGFLERKKNLVHQDGIFFFPPDLI